MIDKKIKVVKKTEIIPKAKKKRRTAGPRATAARQIVANVTDWVTDLKSRRSEETKAAFDLLFAAQRPSES